MSRERNAGTRAFLIELFLSLAILTVCGLVCAAAFVRADDVSRGSRERTRALNCMQSVLERAKAARDMPETGEQFAWFDGDWNPVEQADAEYVVEAAYDLSGDGMLTIRLTARRGERVIETLAGGKYLPGRDAQPIGEVQP